MSDTPTPSRPLSIPPVLVIIVVLVLLGASLLIGRVFLLGEQVPDFGGVYVEGVAGSPIAINPLFSQFNEVDKDIAALIFSGLTKITAEGEVMPDLASGWEISPDGTSYTFTLRSNVRWHDGEQFTADDVVFTVQAIQDPDFLGFPDLAALWRSFEAEKLDELRVRFILEEPFSPFLTYSTIGILPSHILESASAGQLAEHPFNVQPVGTGPFRLESGTIEGVTLAANRDYYQGPPYLDTIELRFFPDEQTAVSGLIVEGIDGFLMRPDVAAISLSRVLQEERLRSFIGVRSSYVAVFLNNDDPLFEDPRVRQALMLALDRGAIIRTAAGGQAVVANSPLLPNTWPYQPVLLDMTRNQQRAAALLDEAGWRLGADGVRVKNGKPFRFALLSDDDGVRIQIIQLISRQLEEVGIQAEPSVSSFQDLIPNFLVPRRFQALVYGLDLGYDPDPYLMWHSSQIQENGFNFASFVNPEVDSLLERGRTVFGREERATAYREFQQIFAREMPSLILFHPTMSYVVDRRIKGIEFGILFEPSFRFTNVSDWYVNSRRKEPEAPTPVLE